MIADCEAHFAETWAYLWTKGDVMLELRLAVRDRQCVVELALRERPVYYDGHSETDLLEVSGVVVPALQEIARVPLLDPAVGDDPSRIRYRAQPGVGDAAPLPEFEVDRAALLGALLDLVGVIRDHETRIILFEVSYMGGGYGRTAAVSVTNLSALRGFDDPALAALPDTYNTADDRCATLLLPPVQRGLPPIRISRQPQAASG
jgi:hypothetical protein